MTQTQFIQEFRTYSTAEKSAIVRQLLQIFEEDLPIQETHKNVRGDEKLLEKKRIAFENLRGALKMKNPPMTKQEERELIYEHLVEKYK